MPLIRVRPLLSTLNSVERQELKKLLPPKLKAPEDPGSKYPAALLAAIAAVQPGNQYSIAGLVTEQMVSFPPSEITSGALITAVQTMVPQIQAEKILKSKTTEPYLAHLRETRKKMDLIVNGPLRHEEAIGSVVEGHPDFRTDTQIFEVKMTGQMSKQGLWQDFLFLLLIVQRQFTCKSYAKIMAEITENPSYFVLICFMININYFKSIE